MIKLFHVRDREKTTVFVITTMMNESDALQDLQVE